MWKEIGSVSEFRNVENRSSTPCCSESGRLIRLIERSS